MIALGMKSENVICLDVKDCVCLEQLYGAEKNGWLGNKTAILICVATKDEGRESFKSPTASFTFK